MVMQRNQGAQVRWQRKRPFSSASLDNALIIDETFIPVCVSPNHGCFFDSSLFAASLESLSQTDDFKTIQGQLTIYIIISLPLIFRKTPWSDKCQP
jgi:hypothetical protein